MPGECCYGMQLQLDPTDNFHVKHAMDFREKLAPLPDNEGSNREGELLAEICRGWLEMLGQPIPSRPESSNDEMASSASAM